MYVQYSTGTGQYDTYNTLKKREIRGGDGKLRTANARMNDCKFIERLSQNQH